MTHIEKLLRKYNTPYAPGEQRSKEYNNKINTEYRHKDKLLILDELNNELPYEIKLNKHEKELVASLLKVFQKDIKYLNRQAKNEAIILAIIFTIKRRVKPNLQLKDYAIFRKYGLTTSVLITILSRLANYYILHNPQVIYETTRYDHEILYDQQFHQRMI